MQIVTYKNHVVAFFGISQKEPISCLLKIAFYFEISAEFLLCRYFAGVFYTMSKKAYGGHSSSKPYVFVTQPSPLLFLRLSPFENEEIKATILR